MTVQMIAGSATYDVMVDIDDVLMPWFEVVDAKCKALGLDRNNAGPCRDWNMWDHYGCDKSEWESAVVAAIQEGLYSSTPPIPGAVEATNRMMWAGHRIHLVTARGFATQGSAIREWTKAWVEEFGIAHTNLIFAKNKAAAMAELGVIFDYAIDDGWHNYEVLANEGVNVWLCSAPHNLHRETEYRVGSLWEFSDIVLGNAA